MRAIELIRIKIEQEVFDYTQLMSVLVEYKKPRDVVTSLIKTEQIIRIRKGLYIFGKTWRRKVIEREMLANLIFGPSVLSLDYALSYYGLIPERIEELTSITSGRSRVFNTPIGIYSYTQLGVKKLSFGYSIQKSSDSSWLIATPLKALFDKVWCDKRFTPTSPSSFFSYLVEDLRIDMEQLKSYLDKGQMMDYKVKYSSRKINWLTNYLAKEIG